MSKQSIKLYENKVEEQNTLSLVSTLVFGFSITLMVESDEKIFIGHDAIAYIFGVSVIIVIVCSALSTLILMGTSFIFRRYMFRMSLSSLQTAKNQSIALRLYARKMVYLSFIGSFISLGTYGHAKWSATNYEILYTLSYVVLGIGMTSLAYIWFALKKINESAYDKLSNHSNATPKKRIMIKEQSH